MNKIILKLHYHFAARKCVCFDWLTSSICLPFGGIGSSNVCFAHHQVENMVTSIERRDLANGVIEITHNARAERWLVVRKTVDTRQMSLQVCFGKPNVKT